MTDILCCKACGHALTIVCPEHGTDWVPDRRMGPRDEPAPTRPPRPLSQLRTRIVAAIAAGHDRAPAIAAACGMKIGHAYVELSNMVKDGQLVRPATGVYAVTAGGR